jgi:Family of unknown function (DUF6521)
MVHPSRVWEQRWLARPREEAANLNPAFCGELIFRSVSEYQRRRELPFPFALSFVILPLALHKRTRDQLPGTATTAFVGWVANHGPALAEFPNRTLRLTPITREAIMFAMQHEVLMVQHGGLAAGPKPIRLRGQRERTTDDADEARRAASLLGRWFANQGYASSILQGLGVAP